MRRSSPNNKYREGDEKEVCYVFDVVEFVWKICNIGGQSI